MVLPRRLTLYIVSELATATIVAVAVWTVILLLNDLFFIARQAIQKDLGAEVVLQILLLKIPNLLVLAIPVGTLLGSLIAVGRFSADGEIIAFQASGLGPFQLIRPMAIHGLATFVLAFSIYAFIQPWASYELRSMQGRIITARNVSTEVRPRVFFDTLPGYVLFVDDIPPGTSGHLERTVLYQAPQPDGSGNEQLIVAKHATIAPTPDQAGRLRLTFRDGVAHAFKSADPEIYRSSQFDSFSPAPIVLPAWMQPTASKLDKTVADMTPADLRVELATARAQPESLIKGYRVRAATAEVHRRLALPFASFVFALLALPLGVTRVRSGKGAGFALSLGIVLAYWMVFTVGLEQARDGRVPVALGIWGANLLVVIWMVVAYLRMRHHERGSWWRPMIGAVRRGLSHAAFRLRKLRRTRGAAVVEETSGEADRTVHLSAVLDRYIATVYLRVLGLSLAATYLIFSLVELKGLIDAVVEHKLPAILIVRYFKYFIPGALVFTLPFAAMIAAVLAITVLSRHGEITALKAAGMSVHRICLPILLLTVLLCGVLHLIQDRIAPETNRRAQAVKDVIQGRNPRTYGWSPGGRWTFGTDGRLYHYRLFDPQSLKFQGLSVFRVDLGAARIFEQWFCQSVRWNGDAWEAEKGWYRTFPEPGTAGDYRRFDKESIAVFDPPDSFTRREQTLTAGNDLPQQASIEDLDEQITSLAKSGYDTTQLRVEYWQKTASVATPIVTVLLGLPFAFKVGRRGSMYGVGVGLILAIVFWAIAAIFNALGLETILPPLLAAWSPNVFFSALGAYLLLFSPT
jgi:LPS export ABC transporter permease LptG/LPS export ABC transporter permease LptF